MKLAANRIDGFVRAPDPAVRVALVYGPDGGLVRERGEALVRAAAGDSADPFRVATLTGGDVLRDPARLADEFAALSLIGGRRAVRVREAGDGLAPAVTAVLEGPGGDCLVVLEAGELAPRSALRKLCEEAGAAVALPCYLPDAAAMGRLVHEVLGEAGLSVDRDAEAFLAEALAGDRQLARRELDKLIAFMGDDLSDMRVMHTIACPIAVADADQGIKDIALHVTHARGGHGAVREAIWAILRAQGRLEHVMALYS